MKTYFHSAIGVTSPTKSRACAQVPTPDHHRRASTRLNPGGFARVVAQFRRKTQSDRVVTPSKRQPFRSRFMGPLNHEQNLAQSLPTTCAKQLANGQRKTPGSSESTSLCPRDFENAEQIDPRAVHASHIQIPHIERVLLDEFAAGFDLVAHEDAEEVVGCADVFHADLQERAVGGVERGFAKLLGVHFAEAFEPGDLQAFFAGGADGGGQAAEVFEAGFVFAAAERVAASFFAGALLWNERFDREAELGEVGAARC